MKYRFGKFEHAARCFAVLCVAICPGRATTEALRSLQLHDNPETMILAWHREIRQPSFQLRATRDSLRLVFVDAETVITLNATRSRLSIDTAPPWLRPPTVDAICAAVQRGEKPDINTLIADRDSPVDS